jgi:hypothetical protein
MSPALCTKLIAPEAAARLVKSGDWVEYGGALAQPDLFDRADPPAHLGYAEEILAISDTNSSRSIPDACESSFHGRSAKRMVP